MCELLRTTHWLEQRLPFRAVPRRESKRESDHVNQDKGAKTRETRQRNELAQRASKHLRHTTQVCPFLVRTHEAPMALATISFPSANDSISILLHFHCAQSHGPAP